MEKLGANFEAARRRRGRYCSNSLAKIRATEGYETAPHTIVQSSMTKHGLEGEYSHTVVYIHVLKHKQSLFKTQFAIHSRLVPQSVHDRAQQKQSRVIQHRVQVGMKPSLRRSPGLAGRTQGLGECFHLNDLNASNACVNRKPGGWHQLFIRVSASDHP